MNMRLGIVVPTVISIVVWIAVASSEETKLVPAAKEASTVEAQPSDSVTLARDQAKLMHQIYSATLDVMHEQYFRKDRDTVPARAMEGVFSEMKRQTKIQSRWIGVNAKTMSVDHEPKDDFEKFAARSLGKGETAVERTEGKLYRRAEAIPLSSGCLSCHGTFGVEPKTPRVAALVIGIPLKD